MKIVIILVLAFISLSLVSANTEGICRTIEVKVTSSMQAQSQTFTLDVKKLRNISFDVNKSEFENSSLVPIEQVGFVLEKTSNSKVLDVIHHKYLRNEPEQVWLPYSYTGNWSRNGLIINNQMARTSTSKQETPLVSFEFVNDVDLLSVTDADVSNILDNLISNSNKRKNTKSFVKNSIFLALNDLKTTEELEERARNTEKASLLAEIEKIKVLIKQTTVEINTITTTITKTETLYSTSQKELDETSNKISQTILLIKQLQIEIEKATQDLLVFDKTEPADLATKTTLFEQAIKMVKYPTEDGKSFLLEYGICTSERKKSINDNYSMCVPTVNTVQQLQACLTVNSDQHLVKRKLRRGKF